MHVIIGVDPHKASHTAVAIDDERGRARPEEGPGGTNPGRAAAGVGGAVPERGRGRSKAPTGSGYLLAQQLVAAGEHVVDVPATLAARTRVLGTGRSNKNDPNDALSVAVDRACAPTVCVRSGRSVTARCCACWRSATPTSATTGPGSCAACTRCWSSSTRAGSPRKSTLLTSTGSSPRSPGHPGRAGPLRPGRRAARRHPPPRRAAQGVPQDGSAPRSPRRARRVTDVFGIGPIIAAMLIGYTGDISRFANRDRYAAYNGTAPVEFSSGGRTVHRVSPRGNRNSTTRSTWPRSASSATPTPTAAPTSTDASPRARPRRKRSGRSSARSATPSTATSSPTPPHADG